MRPRTRHLLGLAALAAAAALPAQAGALLPGQTATLITLPGTLTPVPATAGPSDLGGPRGRAVSADGRYVVFQSRADGLAADDDDRALNIYRRDTVTNETILVSRADGPAGAAANATSRAATISDDGTRVAFLSAARFDLADTNDFDDVYVRDTEAGTTRLVSRAAGGGPVASAGATGAEISGDGAYVAFVTTASGLGPSDMDATADVYRAGVDDGSVVMVSLSDVETESVGVAGDPSIDTDGDTIAFTHSLGLTPGEITDSAVDVYLRRIGPDGPASRTFLVSRTAGGADTEGLNHQPSVSGAGDRVAFESHSDDLVAGDTDPVPDIVLRPVAPDGTGAPELVSRQSADGGSPVCDGVCVRPQLAVVAGQVHVTYLAQGAPALTGTDGSVLVRRRMDAATTVVGRADGAGGAILGDATNAATGRGTTDVAFTTADAGAVAGDSPDFPSVVLRRGAATLLVSHPTGTPDLSRALNGSFIPGGAAVAPITSSGGGPVITPDGRYAVILSDADALLPAGLPVVRVDRQAFRRDLVTGEMLLASRHDGPAGAPAGDLVQNAAISADGRFVAFSVTDPGLAATVGATAESQVYRRDLVTGTTVLVSRADGPAGAPAGAGVQAGSGLAISADGARIAFVASSPGLAAGQSAPVVHVFRRDVAAGTTTLVSRAGGAAGAELTGDSRDPAISADGTRVAFVTDADGLDGEPGTPDSAQIVVRDLALGTTGVASATDGGALATGDSAAPTLSGDGRLVAFSSRATNLDAADGSAGTTAYVRDLALGTTRAVGRADGVTGQVDPGDQLRVRIAPDGGHVLFTTTSPLVVTDTNAGLDAYVRDLATGATLRARLGEDEAVLSSFGGADLAGGARCVLVQTRDGSLQPGSPTSRDFDLVGLLALAGPCAEAPPAPPGPGPVDPGPGPGPAPVDPGPGPAPDTAAPALTGVRLAPARFRVVGVRVPPGPRRPARAGTVLRLTLSEAATVRVQVQRRAAGKRVGGRCLAPSRARRTRPNCIRFVPAGTLTLRARPAGAQRIAITGRIGRRALAPGGYRLVVTAADPAGNRSAPRTLTATVVRR